MALQTSGAISVGQIYDEVSDSTRPSPIGLSALENGIYRPITRYPIKPNGATPSTMGEWYGYQGGHIINIVIEGSISGITEFVFDYFSDDNVDGYEYLSGISTSGITYIYPENPLYFYTDLSSGNGSIYFNFIEMNSYITYVEFYDSNNNHLISNYAYFTDANYGYIYYFIGSGQSSNYYYVKLGIGFY